VTLRDGRIQVLRRAAEDGSMPGASLPPPPGLAEDLGPLFPAFAAAAHRPVPVLQLAALAERDHTMDRRRTLAFGLLALACWLVAASVFEVRTGGAEARAADELGTLRPMLEQALTVERDIAQAEDALGRIAEARAMRSRDAALLAAVTRALPDSACLLSLRRGRDGRVTLMGVAPSAARVVTALAGTPGIGGPVIEGGIARETTPQGVREQFHIAFNWNPRGGAHD
jgi:general secretion pathway protein L